MCSNVTRELLEDFIARVAISAGQSMCSDVSAIVEVMDAQSQSSRACARILPCDELA